MTIWEHWQRLPPETKEPIKSAIVSTGLALQTAAFALLGAAVQAGEASDPGALARYFIAHWWGVAIGLILPAAYRARQGKIAAENTVNLPNGASAVLIPPKGI